METNLECFNAYGRACGSPRSLRDAAYMVSSLGIGATVKLGAVVLWTEGTDGIGERSPSGFRAVTERRAYDAGFNAGVL